MDRDQHPPTLPVLAETSRHVSPRRISPARQAVVLAFRWLLIGLLIGALHTSSADRRARRAARSAAPAEVPPSTLLAWFGKGASEVTFDATASCWNIADSQGEMLGRVVETLPAAESVSGYRGPSNLLVGIDAEDTIVGVRVLESADTVDHVRSIERSDHFFAQFSGRSADDSFRDIDGVSGATLSCLAMAEAVSVRLGHRLVGSARFPAPISAEERSRSFASAVRWQKDANIPATLGAFDEQGQTLGWLARTGPLADDRNGYQGPSELLLQFDPQDRLQQVDVRRTFDNEPYASYIKDEPWYWDPFLGKTPKQLARADLDALGIEGVSGATMSTLAAAETLVAAAEAIVEQRAAASAQANRGDWGVRWSWKDVATACLLGGALWMTFARFAGKRRIRWIWQLLVIGLFGLVTGNLLSIALLFGWSAGGVPWRLAPGLAAVVVFAFVVPLLTKAPIYCTQLCPHGAIQQWLRGRLAWRLPISPRINRLLLMIPGLLCCAAYLVVLTGLPWNLAQWEPFDAYLVSIGFSVSLLVAIVSLGLAAITPMGYCRFACPTGRILSYTRRHGQSGRWTASDWGVVILAALAWGWVFWQRADPTTGISLTGAEASVQIESDGEAASADGGPIGGGLSDHGGDERRLPIGIQRG